MKAVAGGMKGRIFMRLDHVHFLLALGRASSSSKGRDGTLASAVTLHVAGGRLPSLPTGWGPTPLLACHPHQDALPTRLHFRALPLHLPLRMDELPPHAGELPPAGREERGGGSKTGQLEFTKWRSKTKGQGRR